MDRQTQNMAVKQIVEAILARSGRVIFEKAIKRVTRGEPFDVKFDNIVYPAMEAAYHRAGTVLLPKKPTKKNASTVTNDLE